MDFIPARHYTPTNGRNINLIVIHTMESNIGAGVARGCANYFSGPNAPQASAHYNIDSAECVQSVRDKDVAWHAAQNYTNNRSIGVEHAGRAAMGFYEWLDGDANAELALSAQLVAWLCGAYDIPVRWLSPGEVANGEAGICGHSDVTYGYNIYGGHTDPGDGWPREYYIGLVAANLGQAPAPSSPAPAPSGLPTLSKGSTGASVMTLQERLAGFGYWIAPDGSFGQITENVVKDFQAEDGTIGVDGVVGPATWAALDRAEAGDWHKSFGAPAPSAPAAQVARVSPTLQQGNRGGNVLMLQEALNFFNANLATDGAFGPATAGAVRNFQSFWNLAADGIYGPQTAHMMDAALTWNGV